jgi:hypothetical protein
MRANENNFGVRPANFRFDVVTLASIDLVTVSTRLKARLLKCAFDEFSSRVELGIMPHVTLADFAREFLHIGFQFITQRNFLRRSRCCSQSFLARHSHSDPPEYGKGRDDGDANAECAKEDSSKHGRKDSSLEAGSSPAKPHDCIAS